MIRPITDDLYQIGEHVENAHGFEAVRIFVLMNEGNPILIDCGSHLHRQPIMAELDQLLGDTVPEQIFLTHSELPHAGNIAAVAQKWPQIKVVVSNVMLPYIEILPVLPLSQITQIAPGTTYKYETRTLHFVDALLKDQPGSQWIYDSRTETLFTGDGFGYFAPEDEINLFNDELDDNISVAQFEAYHKLAFRFIEWIKPERLFADLDKMLGNRPIKILAPIHGNALRGDLDVVIGRFKAAITNIHRGYHANK